MQYISFALDQFPESYIHDYAVSKQRGLTSGAQYVTDDANSSFNAYLINTPHWDETNCNKCHQSLELIYCEGCLFFISIFHANS